MSKIPQKMYDFILQHKAQNMQDFGNHILINQNFKKEFQNEKYKGEDDFCIINQEKRALL